MPLVVILIILGLVVGGVGFVLEAFAWLLFIGIALIVAGAIFGARLLRGGRRRSASSDTSMRR